MNKEVIISIAIVCIILVLNFITQNYTKNTVSKMKEYLDNTKEELIKEIPNYEVASKKADETLKKWEELDDIIAIYIEHDEIEKVKTAIISMQSFIKTEDDSQSVDSIDRCKYILEHIKQKEEISIDNIF